MKPFSYVKTNKLEESLEKYATDNHACLIAGGTTMVDLMKLNVLSPEILIDIGDLNLKNIERRGNSVFVGALASNSEIAQNRLIRDEFPVLSQAILSGASAQLRNMATAGGNIMQKTRCTYFRDTSFPCNKRIPGSGCPAIDGQNRTHAILGTSKSCVAVHGSDMCVALLALDASIHVSGPLGKRIIPINDFHLLPGNTPERETVLAAGEVITEIEIPLSPFAKQSHYLKLRDRASYAFSLASAAVALDIEQGKIRSCRLALGGVASKPWRLEESEKLLCGKILEEGIFKKAAELGLKDAKALKQNGFKIELAKRCLVRALKTAGGLA